MSQPPTSPDAPGDHESSGEDSLREALPSRLDDDLFDDFRLPGEDSGASHTDEEGREAVAEPGRADQNSTDQNPTDQHSADQHLAGPAPRADRSADERADGARHDVGADDAVEHEDDEESDWSLLSSGAGSTLLEDPEQADADSELDDEQRARAEARRRDRRRRQIRGAVIIGAVLLVLGLLATKLIGALLPGGGKDDYESTSGDEVTFTVNSGEGPIIIGRRLEEEGIIASSGRFKEITEATSGGHIQPGDYTLRERMTAQDAVRGLQGEARVGVSYVVVNPGQRRDEVFENMAEATSHDVSEFEEAAQHPERFGLPEQAKGLEGYIASGEYRLPQTADVDEVLTEVTKPTKDRLAAHGIKDAKKQDRVVTIASILQAEAREEDFATVAGIIENRLDKDNTETHGYLQVDATVIYGLGEQRLQFSDEERQDESNEYNTYQHKGLPPTPIGAPSEAAIAAAAEPGENDYYYWVTVNIDTGETKFATTYEEHQKYQNEYRRWCEDHPDVC